MKSLFILAIALASTSAFARPNTTEMTCRDAAGLVASAGSIVLSTGPYTFNRFYTTGNKAAYVPTLDNDACFIGYVRSADAREVGTYTVEKHVGKSCKVEGQTQIISTPDRGELHKPVVTRTCINGQWVVNGQSKPVIRKCKEGSYGSYSTGGVDHRGEPENLPAVCRNGKYVPVAY